MSSILEPRLLTRLARIQLSSKRRLVGSASGGHRSKRHGSSLDFADYREYQPGDDLRRLDLFAAARLDRLLLRLFEADDDISVRLLLDSSGSMEGAKFERAKEIASAISFVSLQGRDQIMLFTMGEHTGLSGRRFTGSNSLPAIDDALTSIEAGGATPFAVESARVLASSTRPGVTAVISDLLTPESLQAIRRLPARGSELLVIHIIDPADYSTELYGDLELVDSETGERVEVSVSASVASKHAERAEEWRQSIEDQTHSVGGAYLPCSINDDLENYLFTALLGLGR